MNIEHILPNLYRFEDTCNVYVVISADGRDAAAVDFGSGAWLDRSAALGLPPVSHIFLTHHHADQCAGLAASALASLAHRPVVHAPPGERAFLEPEGVAEFWRTRRGGGVPRSYSVAPGGIGGAIACDLEPWSDLFWGDERVRLISTPGHSRGAVSVLMDVGPQQVLFCGDAAHAGATIWQPYHLEWDHWTGEGALQAWEGVQRLLGIRIDVLCPSHGPVVAGQVAPMLRQLSRRLLNLYRAKGSICAGERDGYLPPKFLACGARQVLPGLIQFGVNSYLVLSNRNEALVIDPWSVDIGLLEPLLDELGRPRVTAATATHYHLDHSDGLPVLKERYGTAIWLHPEVAAPLREIGALDVPWLPAHPIAPDHLLPGDGVWRWNEYAIRVGHFPGQTWWHCGLMAVVAGRKVFFGGDSFQPPSRWNGTGGFSAFNGSRFREGFVASAQKIMDWKPDVVACGHGTCVRYNAAYYRKVIRWARAAEQAVQALCPAGELGQYYGVTATSAPSRAG